MAESEVEAVRKYDLMHNYSCVQALYKKGTRADAPPSLCRIFFERKLTRQIKHVSMSIEKESRNIRSTLNNVDYVPCGTSRSLWR